MALLAIGGMIISFTAAAAPTLAQSSAAAQMRSTPSAPDGSAIVGLIVSTLSALDHANLTGNYTVFRDLGAPGFREANDATRLAQIFTNVRAQRLELSRLYLGSPQLAETPTLDQNGMLRVKGLLPAQPKQIFFELLYQWGGERWGLFGISVGTADGAAPPERTPQARQSGNSNASSAPLRK